MADTAVGAPHTIAARRGRTPRAALLLVALVGALTPASIVRAEPREVDATVVWTRAGVVYVASPDSGALETGQLVTLDDRDRAIAAGPVMRVIDGVLAVVRLTSGSLDDTKHLDRLRVRAERPPVAPLPLLRIGVPRDARSNLAVACARVSPAGALEALGYTVEETGAAEWRGVMAARSDSSRAWPDTLLVRAFRLAADEEIALERGELDAAVFWPGEMSAHLRDDPRGRDALLGRRARGVLAALQPVPHGPDAGSDRLAAAIHADAALGALDEQMFGGDLEPWSEVDSTIRAAETLRSGHAVAPVLVDAALPGQRVLQRFLDRDLPAALRVPNRAVHLTVLDEPAVASDSVRAAWRARGVVPLAALRCAIACAPARREYLRALGADALAGLPACGGGRRP